MALVKKTPAFETEPTSGADTAASEAPAQAAAAASTAIAKASEAPAAAAVAASTAIAKASTTSLSVADAAHKAKAFAKEVEAMKDASDFSYGNYRTFKGNNGGLEESGDKGVSLGRWAQVRLMSWGEHTEISPGESGASTKDFVAYSKDGVNIDSVIGEELQMWVGKSVQGYADFLRDDEGFAKTKVRKFIDTACFLLATDSGDGPIGKTIQVTLSESSIPSFARYQNELKDDARAVAMGLPGATLPEDPFQFFFLRELASKSTHKWTKLRIVSSLPAKL